MVKLISTFELFKKCFASKFNFVNGLDFGEQGGYLL